MNSAQAAAVAFDSSRETAFRRSIRWIHQTDSATVIKFDNREKPKILPPYLYLNVGETLQISHGHNGDIESVHKVIYDRYENREYRLPVFPLYSVTEQIHVPPHVLPVTFCQRNNPAEWRSARLLEKFHYRGMGLNKIVGRRSVLLAKLDGFGVVGYGVVSSSVAAARPRFKLLETSVQQLMQTKLINKLVRIPRIVIHPEFRGLGLGAMMAHHLVQYVQERWDIRGYKPILVEVIAAMTEYHRFFEAAGFVKLGYTQGYSGLAIKPQYGKGSFARRENTDRYRFMVDQKPKPYLAFPLTSEVESRVLKMAGTLGPTKEILRKPLTLDKSLHFHDVSVEYRSQNGLTSRARAIKESFGVDSSQMYSSVLRKLSLSIQPGDAVLLTGASGSGKSTIIKLLTETKDLVRKEMQVEGVWQTSLRKTAQLGKESNNRHPLVNQVGNDLHDAISILNGVGLAEAHLYLKHPKQLSEGQRYRFAVALLCDSGKPIWIADEFASTLDALTAAIAAKGIRKLAYRRGATLILAAPHVDHFLKSLLPNVLVKLRWGGLAEILCMRVKVRKLHGKWAFSIVNSGSSVVTGVEIGGTDTLGRFHKLADLGSLLHNQRATFSLDPSRATAFNAIQIRSDNGIGDIIFLEDKHGSPKK